MGRGPRSEQSLSGAATAPRRSASHQDPSSRVPHQESPINVQADPRVSPDAPFYQDDLPNGARSEPTLKFDSAADARRHMVREIINSKVSGLRQQVSKHLDNNSAGTSIKQMATEAGQYRSDLSVKNKARQDAVQALKDKREARAEQRVIQDAISTIARRQGGYYSDLARLNQEAEAGNELAANIITVLKPAWIDRKMAESTEPASGDMSELTNRYFDVVDKACDQADETIAKRRMDKEIKDNGGRLMSTAELGLSGERVTVSEEETHAARLSHASAGSYGGGMGGEGSSMGGMGMGRRAGRQRPSGMPRPSRQARPTGLEQWSEEFANFLVG